VEDEFDDRPSRRKKTKITKPAYADFKETRQDKNQLTCECGSQSWHLWSDMVASCSTCGLPEPIIQFTIRDTESAAEFLEELMA
jgi:ribosomal protein L37E